MQKKTSIFLGALAAGLLLMQCEGTTTTAAPVTNPATGKEVVNATGTPVQKVGNLEQSWQIGGSSFTFENGRYYGNSGCNDVNGTYALLDGNRVQIQPAVMTRKMCMDQDVMQQEANFAQNFPGIYDIKSTGTTLILQNDQRSWVLVGSTQ